MGPWKYVLAAACSVGLVSSAAVANRAEPVFSVLGAPSEQFTDIEPSLLPESVPSTGPANGGEFVFAVVVDTTGQIENATVQTLIAKDSASARALRQQLGSVRYVPGRMVQVTGSCVRINRGVRHCGGKSPQMRSVRRRVLLQLEFESPAPR